MIGSDDSMPFVYCSGPFVHVRGGGINLNIFSDTAGTRRAPTSHKL